jgi:hypothetical protein
MLNCKSIVQLFARGICLKLPINRGVSGIDSMQIHAQLERIKILRAAQSVAIGARHGALTSDTSTLHGAF